METPTHTYTAAKPPLAESSEELRARIPGWGADLDPAERPSYPREQLDPDATGAHWTFPERQPEERPRERSMEHAFLTPVFGTSAPLSGLSGVVRRLAYRRYSEARAAHWLLLMAADRIDVKENLVRGLLAGRPDNPVTETGILSERSRHGWSSRVGQRRADVQHHLLDPLVVAGPWLVTAWAARRALRRVRG
ncbi:MAG TPA: hypothetical protein VD814_12010 [Nocardioides sp.]|nr:hypothetical protein [Nocardioides sp.]